MTVVLETLVWLIEEIKNNVLLLLCLLLYFAASFLNFRRSRTVLVFTAFIKNSLSSTYTHTNKLKEDFGYSFQ